MNNKLNLKKLKNKCVEVSQILKALSHPQRLLIMGNLIDGEKTVTDLVEASGVSQSQISQFLGRMKTEGLIKSKRDGKYQIYFLEDEKLKRIMSVLHNEYCK